MFGTMYRVIYDKNQTDLDVLLPNMPGTVQIASFMTMACSGPHLYGYSCNCTLYNRKYIVQRI